jgi:DNA-binding MarR family transcriptional regulator
MVLTLYCSSMDDIGVVKKAVAGAPDRTIFELLHAAATLEDKVGAALGKVGLSMPKFAVLNELVTAGQPISLSDLATRLSCVKSNMTQLIDRLEADGLVKRVDDPSDRRSVRAEITAEGAARQAAGSGEIDKLHEEFAAATGAEDRAAFGRLLAALK